MLVKILLFWCLLYGTFVAFTHRSNHANNTNTKDKTEELVKLIVSKEF